MNQVRVNPEFASLIPPLTPEERAGLERSILEEGVREPIITWHGYIVDGHNRYEIATAHGLDFETIEYDFADDTAVKFWMINNQLGRRNLEPLDRIILEQSKATIIREKAKQNQGTRNDLQPFIKNDKRFERVNTQAEIAKNAGVSQGLVAQVEQIQKHAPNLIEEIRRGKQTIGGAYKQIRRRERKAERIIRKEYTASASFPEHDCRLYIADIRDGLPEVKSGSIDAVICDPPYPREYLALYGYLADVAARVLKPGGMLLAMAGQSYLWNVLELMKGRGLDYHWTLAYLTPGGQSPHLFSKNVNTFWKPIIWMQKCKYEGDCIGDVLKSDVNDNDKRFHKWGQSVSGFADIVERFTNPGQTILDPFLGGGTTGYVALSMGRKFIGCDIDGDLVKAAEKRMRDAYECK